MSDPTHHSTPPGTAATSASAVLANRVLIQASCADALRLSASTVTGTGDLVVTGAQARATTTRLRQTHPSAVMCVDAAPETTWHASADAPFDLGEADLYSEPSLERSLDDQRDAGASIALTPTGHIAAGDSAALKAVIREANKLHRDDVVVRLPCDAAWATPAYGKQLAAVISRSNHPVALSLAHEQDPLERAGAAELLWEMAATQPHLLLWRSDLAGLAHLANGGLGAAVGFSATLRHGVRPGRKGFVNNVQDKTPGILLPDWLRYMRGSRIETIFAATHPPRCTCSTCRGRALDRFGTSAEDKFTAQQHNIAVIGQMMTALSRLSPAQRGPWWARSAALAVQTHADATAQTSVHLALPRAVQTWARLPVPAT